MDRMVIVSHRFYNIRRYLLIGFLATLIVTGVAFVAIGRVDRTTQFVRDTAERYNAHTSSLARLGGVPAAPQMRYPAQVLDLRDWYLTLPVGCTNLAIGCHGSASQAAEIFQPELSTFSDSYFHVDGTGDAIVFQAGVDGTTTVGSSYPRSELREMAQGGMVHAAWSTTGGAHVLVATEAVTHLPVSKAQVVTAQIHNATSDVVEVIVDGPGIASLGPDHYRICVRFGPNHGKETGPCLDSSYQLGEYYTLVIEAASGQIKIWYAKGVAAPAINGTPSWQESYSGVGNYFKVGVYTQSNLSQGDSPGSYGEVELRNVRVTHQ